MNIQKHKMYVQKMNKESRLEEIYVSKKYVTSDDAKKEEIPSWLFLAFVKKKKLLKLAPGFYASPEWPVDEYYLLQWRFPQFIFSNLSALYLLGLTEKIVDVMEVTAPFGYHPNRKEIPHLVIHYERHSERYRYDIITVDTIFGNKVRVYGYTKTIVDMIRNRKDYEDEVFIKALKRYVKENDYDSIKLHEYAKLVKADEVVSDLMEVVADEN
jgi:hypothetical protein